MYQVPYIFNLSSKAWIPESVLMNYVSRLVSPVRHEGKAPRDTLCIVFLRSLWSTWRDSLQQRDIVRSSAPPSPSPWPAWVWLSTRTACPAPPTTATPSPTTAAHYTVVTTLLTPSILKLDSGTYTMTLGGFWFMNKQFWHRLKIFQSFQVLVE